MKKFNMPLLKSWELDWKRKHGYHLFGYCYEDNRCADGDVVVTSRLKFIDFDEGIAETQNTHYRLDGIWNDKLVAEGSSDTRDPHLRESLSTGKTEDQ